MLAAFPPNPDIAALELKREQLKGGVYKVQGTDIEADVRRLTTEISSTKSRLRNIISKEY